MRGRRRQSPLPEHLDLTPDLWREILLRLPVKTLLRFRSVCKTWCSFIDSPDFISMHLKLYQKNSENTHLLSVEFLSKSSSQNPFHFNIRCSVTLRKTGQLVKHMDPIIIGSGYMTDGLLLTHCSEQNLVNPMRLWNPSLRKSVLLPQYPLNSRSLPHNRYFHLGFDSSSNDYKVVCFELSHEKASELSIAIAIYSLRDHCWRVKPNWINVPECWFDLFTYRYGVEFCQGAFYWRPSRNIDGYNHLLSFDLDAEEFSYVKMPNIEEDMLRFCFLLDGSLAVLGISRVRACIWVMGKNNGKELWKHLSSGDSDLNAYEFFDICRAPRMRIRFIGNPGTLLVHNNNKVMFYNIMSHQAKQKKFKYFQCLHLSSYAESLVLHKGYEHATSTSLT